jgi:hypothetical protein
LLAASPRRIPIASKRYYQPYHQDYAAYHHSGNPTVPIHIGIALAHIREKPAHSPKSIPLHNRIICRLKQAKTCNSY